MELINSTYETEEENILGILRKIKEENPTVLADDIGIIFIDQAKTIFKIADRLELSVPRLLGWKVNKAYETKEKIKDTLFISNKNHVKGLEFPFVICVTRDIIKSHSYRNSLYMMLTRSFIKSYLLLGDGNKDLQNEIEKGLDVINEHGYMDINVPPREFISKIRTTIKYDEKNISHYDLVTKVFDDLQIEPIFRTSLYNTVKTIMPDSFDVDKITTLVRFNYEIMLQESK